MDRAAEGFVGELSEIMAKVFDGIQNLDVNGVLGDPRPAAAAAGKRYFEEVVEFLYQWVEDNYFFQDKIQKKGPCGVTISEFIGIRFSAAGRSGFGCQENEVLNPDT